MAQKRMFNIHIIDSDIFLEMPATTQLLYYHLGMRADDDGFVGAPRKIMRSIGSSEDDMKLLIVKQFVYPFESGIVVIRDWHLNNSIKGDRHTATIYQEEFKRLKRNKFGVYEFVQDTQVQENETLEPQVSIDKYSIDKISIEKNVRHKYGSYSNVLLSDEDLSKLKEEFPTDYEQRIERLSEYIASSGKKYKNHLATIRNWARNDKKNCSKQAKQNHTTDPEFDKLMAGLKEREERGWDDWT